jgi:hypothetical protein
MFLRTRPQPRLDWAGRAVFAALIRFLQRRLRMGRPVGWAGRSHLAPCLGGASALSARRTIVSGISCGRFHPRGHLG